MMTWLHSLKDQGLNPKAVTTDGRQTAIKAFCSVWPGIITQRCLFHIKLQTIAWIRAKPVYDSSKAILFLVNKIDWVKTPEHVKEFHEMYFKLVEAHKEELNNFNPTHPVQADTLRAYSLVRYALPHCFHYLDDKFIASTTGAIEGYFKQIQRIKGFDHCGLTEKHLINFLKWRLYFNA